MSDYLNRLLYGDRRSFSSKPCEDCQGDATSVLCSKCDGKGWYEIPSQEKEKERNPAHEKWIASLPSEWIKESEGGQWKNAKLYENSDRHSETGQMMERHNEYAARSALIPRIDDVREGTRGWLLSMSLPKRRAEGEVKSHHEYGTYDEILAFAMGLRDGGNKDGAMAFLRMKHGSDLLHDGKTHNAYHDALKERRKLWDASIGKAHG